MLQKLNARFQGIITWVIVGLITVTFILFGIDYYLQARQATTETVATVNGVSLSKTLMHDRLEQFRRADPSLVFDKTTIKKLRKKALDQLVLDEVEQQSAINAGFYVSSAQIGAAIMRSPYLQTEGHFSKERYVQVLQSLGLSSEAFQQRIRHEILLNQQQFPFKATEFVLPNELDAYAKKRGETRDYRYITLSIPQALPFIVKKPAETDLKAYYASHKKQYEQPMRIAIDYVELTPKGSSQQFANALDTLTELSYQFPESLDMIVKHMGLKKVSLPWITRDNHPKVSDQWIQAIFSEEVLSGNNSAPIQVNDQSVVVLRIRAQEPARLRSYEEVKDDVAHAFQQEAAEEWMKGLGAQLLKASPQTLSDLMKKYQLKWTTVSKASMVDPKPLSFIRNAFSIETPLMRLGWYLRKEKTYVLLQLDAIYPGHTNGNLAQKKTWMDMLKVKYGNLAYDLYIKYQLSQSKIVLQLN